MKTSQVSDRSRSEPVNNNAVCWSKDAQAQLLRLELADGSFYLFPYIHLTVVKFERHDTDDLLSLRFANHKVQITGKNLRELGLAFQKLVVDWVKELPARFATTANPETVYIAKIEITEIQAPQ